MSGHRGASEHKNRSTINRTREGRVAIEVCFPDRLRGRGEKKERKWYLSRKEWVIWMIHKTQTVGIMLNRGRAGEKNETERSEVNVRTMDGT